MTESADLVPMARFDGTSLPPGMRLAAFSSLTPGYAVRLAPETDPDDFKVECRAWLLGDMAVTSNRLDAVEIHRTPEHIHADRRSTLSFILLKRGSWRGDLETGAIQVGSGQVCVMDFSNPWDVYGTAQENVMLVLSAQTVRDLAPNAPPLHGCLLEGAAGRLLAEHMLALAAHLEHTRLAEIPLVREATLSLVGTALAPLAASPPPRIRRGTAGRAAIIGRTRDFVEERLTDPTLDVATICRGIGVSRAVLYRALGDGVADYIRRRRLEAAHMLLADADGSTSIAEIAERFCFSSHAHFTTAFRAQFGYTPRLARTTGTPSEVNAVFAGWRSTLEGADA